MFSQKDIEQLSKDCKAAVLEGFELSFTPTTNRKQYLKFKARIDGFSKIYNRDVVYGNYPADMNLTDAEMDEWLKSKQEVFHALDLLNTMLMDIKVKLRARYDRWLYRVLGFIGGIVITVGVIRMLS